MARSNENYREGMESSHLGRYDRVWLAGLQNLKRFKEINGRWPNPTERFPGHTQIGQWLYRSRQAYFKGCLVEIRLAHLQKIRCPMNPIRHVDGAWMEQFDRLKRFRARYADRWPFKAEEFPKGSKLGRWFHEQMLRNTRGTLKRSWANLLRSIGFPFRRKVTQRKDIWLVRYGELKKFRKKSPNRWPAKSVGAPFKGKQTGYLVPCPKNETEKGCSAAS